MAAVHLTDADISAVAGETNLPVDQVRRMAVGVTTIAGALQGPLVLPRVRFWATLRCDTTIGRLRRAFWCLMARALSAGP